MGHWFKRFAFLVLFSMLSLSLSAGEPTQRGKNEIAYLIGYLGKSGCLFNRNGTWYESTEAVKHLNQKYEYFLKKGQINNAEDFIRLAASVSSMSGKPYQVKCGSDSPVLSDAWLKAELDKQRTNDLR